MKYKVTEKQFKYFKARVKYWQKKIGLISWRIDCFHKDLEDAYGTCYTDYIGQAASVTLTKYTEDPMTQAQIEETALHEVLEILMSPCLSMAKSRVWDEMDYIKQHHIVIRTVTEIIKEKRNA